MRFQVLALLLWVCASANIWADDPGITFFEKKVRPVLANHCSKCHSEEKKRGKLIIESREDLLHGGESGPAIVPGQPDKSLLIKAIRYSDKKLEMPPNGKLPAAIIADLEKWVAMGAPAPAAPKGKEVKNYGIDLEKGRQFWAFQLPKKHPLPKVKTMNWTYGPVDHFILSKLEQKNIQPVKDVDKGTLIRRAYFSLVGLPPTPQQVDDFIKDKSPDAFAKVVDELLASPHFGERWGRHWLDVARFSESTGGGRSMLLPDAWRYRDYVINSFNQDKPYNLFVKEQIAGDLLNSKSKEERIAQLIATAFLLLGPTNYEMQDKPVLEMDVIDEQLDTIGRSMLGMTIGCARCHDHKFDPIPTADYYALAGIFKNTRVLIHDNVSRWTEQALPMSPEEELVVKKHESAVAALKAKIQQTKSELKKLGVAVADAAQGVLNVNDLPGIIIDDAQAKKIGNWSPSTFMNTYIGKGYLYSGKGMNTLTFSPSITKDGFYEVRLAYLAHTNRATNTPVRILYTDGEKTVRVNQKQTPPIDGRWISLGKYRFEKGDQWYVMLSTKGVDGVVVADAVQFIHEDELDKEPPAKKSDAAQKPSGSGKGPLEGELKKLEANLKKLTAKAPARPVTMAPMEEKKIDDFYICIRGIHTNKGPKVKRGFLQVATIGPMPTLPADQSGRLQLAEWLASEKNPLTARVMVNRIWHHLFGNGIVKSVDNFGATGDMPSHPELLDYLAICFVEQGWSVKKLIREIMLSHTYQLSSQASAGDPTVKHALKEDVNNRLLWKQNRQRLEAECIRDAMLVVSGQLNPKVGGPNIKPGTTVERDYQFTDTRRSVYTPIFRNHLHELFAVFDFPDPNLVAGKRAASTVAPQALYLMNSPFVMEQAKLAAKKTLSEAGLSEALRVQKAYFFALGRMPTQQEMNLALGFITKVGGTGTPAQRETVWAQFYQVLFASIDFRYVN